MKKIAQLTLTGLVLVLLILTPACRTKKVDVKPEIVPTATMAPPDVEPPPVEIKEPTDFVEPQPTVEVIPEDIEKLNIWARDKGFVRDAFYNYDEATLDDAAQSALSASASWLKGKDGAAYNLLIEGHCDERGTEQYNLALGDKRANSAKDYLVTLGVEAGRIRTVSYGEERPFEEGHDDASWSKNRRAHLVLVR